MYYIDKTDPRSPDYEEPMTEEEQEAIEQAKIDREIERRYYTDEDYY